jgi:hypothetical protein
MDDDTKTLTKWVIIIFVVCFVLIPVAVFGIRWVTADARGAGEAREQTRANGSYRIAAYDKFFDLCASIQAQEDRIVIFSDDPSPEGQVNLRAVKAKRTELIRQYNADATKSDTKGHFLASDLPYQINPNEEHTTCAA